MFFQTLKKKVLSGVGQIVLIHYLVIFLCLIQNYLIVKKLNCLLMFLLRLLRILFWYKLLIVFQRRMQEAYQDEIFQLWCAVFNVSARQMQLMGLLQKLVIQHNITGGWIVMKLKRFMCSQAEHLYDHHSERVKAKSQQIFLCSSWRIPNRYTCSSKSRIIKMLHWWD